MIYKVLAKKPNFILVICFCIIVSSAFADIKSTSNVILFKPNLNSSEVMTLNEHGLGIGVSPSTNLHVAGNVIVTGKLNVGSDSSSSSNLTISGTIGYGLSTITSSDSPYALGNTSTVLLDTSLGNIVLTLPYAGNVSGRIYTLKKTNLSGEVIISADNLIDNEYKLIMTENASEFTNAKIMSNGIDWFVLSMSANTELTSNFEAFYDMHSDFTTTEENVARESDAVIAAASSFNSVVTVTSPVNLIDYTSGKVIDSSINFDINATQFTSNGADPSGGDALALFGSKIDMSGGYIYGSGGKYFDAVFSGLNSDKQYTIATYVNRGSDASRVCQVELFDMLSATNSSSAGAVAVSGNYVQIDADNTSDGHIGRWDDIILPAGNTTLRLKVTQISGSATFPTAFYIRAYDL